MRAKEFTNFTFDIEPYEGWTGEGVVVHAYDGKDEIGHVIFEPTEYDPTQWYAVDVEVEEQYRRIGIATKMYDMAKQAAKSAGAIIVKSHAQSDDGRGLWGDKKVWEQQVNEYKEYPTREYEGVTFTMKEKDGQLIVKPLNDYGISMGHVIFNMDGKILDPQDLVIADKYQGQGIAKVMYDYIKSQGFTIERSWDQTPAGAGFWNKHRGEDVRVWEDIPQPGPSSGAPKQFGPDAKIQTRQMTVKDIISSVPGLPYYNNVVDDWDAKDYSWGVTKKVIEYAQYLKQHPESLAKLPPILVLNGKFEDGAHRISAIWLLQQRMDPKNPLWKNAKLNVQFVKQGVSEDLTTGRNLNTDTEKYVKNHKWKLTTVNPMDLDTDAFDDPYNRVIDIDVDHPVNFKDPIILDSNGVIIDGFHRAYQAQKAGLKTIPAYVPVEEQLEESTLPSVLYHATYRPLLKSIKQHGLGGDKAQAKWEDSKPGVVYLATDPDIAESYAESSDVVPEEWLDNIVVLKIDASKLDQSKLMTDQNVLDNVGDTLEYHGTIPVNLIS